MKQKNHIKYNIGRTDLNCHIDAVHAKNPLADLFTGNITNQIIKKIDVSAIIATTSRTEMDLNRPRNKKNAPAIDEYRNAIKEIIESKNITDEKNILTQDYLHIALHGMKDTRGFEFAIGTRNGETCSNEILEWFLNELNSFSKSVSVNKILSGDSSKSFHRYGDSTSEYNGYGEKFHTIQVEINNTLRRNRQEELSDFFAQILVDFNKI